MKFYSLCLLLAIASSATALKLDNLLSPDNKLCDACQLAVYNSKEELDAGTTSLFELELQLTFFCDNLPFVDETCTQFVAGVIKGIEQNQEPLEICQNVKLCTKDELKSKDDPDMDPHKLCVACQIAVQNSKEELDAGTTSTFELELQLNFFCENLPFVDDSCTKFVAGVIKGIEQDLEPLEICQSVDICKKEELESQIDDYDGYGCYLCQKLGAATEQQAAAGSSSEDIKANLQQTFCDKLVAYADHCRKIVDNVVERIVSGELTGQQACELGKFCGPKPCPI